MRTHAPTRPPVEDDWLLPMSKVGRRLGGMHPKNVGPYVRRWDALVAGLRVVRARFGTRGELRLLRSALMDHLHRGLLEDRDHEPISEADAFAAALRQTRAAS